MLITELTAQVTYLLHPQSGALLEAREDGNTYVVVGNLYNI